MFIRKRKDRGFTTIDNHAILNPELSYKAKGILLYLVSRPENWKVYLSDLVKRSKDKRGSVESGLDELIEQGYLIKFQYRKDDGKFDTLYYYDDIPLDKESEEIQEILQLFTDAKNQQRLTGAKNPQRENRSEKLTSSNKRESNQRTNKNNIINKQPETIDGRNTFDVFKDILDGKIK